MKTKEVADQLVAFCREGKWEDAQRKLYADNAVSIEPEATPAFAKETKGLKAIFEKGHAFSGMVEKIHSIKVSEPLVAEDAIAFLMTMDSTMKGRPRGTMSEICVYEVEDGKIVSEQFHY
jgi:hypothetical protein